MMYNHLVQQQILRLLPSPGNLPSLTGEDPDITGYCVDVINSTSSVTLLSECGITETEFTYLMPPHSFCYSTTFSFSIAPLNIVGRGEVATLFYMEHLLSKIMISYANLQF